MLAGGPQVLLIGSYVVDVNSCLQQIFSYRAPASDDTLMLT